MIARLVTSALGLACTVACAQSSPMTATPTPQSGWRPLFDGRTTAGWRGFRQDSMPAGWRVVDGALTRVAEAGDIVTVEQFANFELELEWSVAPGGNSGIMFRVTEDSDATYKSGPEMQVLDDAAHPDGQWNAVRLVVNGAHVEHWLNGVKVVEYELWSPEWEAQVAATKFAQWPGYGRARAGHIALQDHGDRVSYRSIRIRVLP